MIIRMGWHRGAIVLPVIAIGHVVVIFILLISSVRMSSRIRYVAYIRT